ncbi:hypothetical protein J5N97_010150 [Dioscorea zingiberensis]|uniref:Protein kinase domain-containing protein n=1 Tax=Dioscorea zingiberensis TaxID=325984 RepID=A0A9D5D0U2_9LILI|nr:hypothetical protein J5N97_010150 [Dioscorea zingiberensis]
MPALLLLLLSALLFGSPPAPAFAQNLTSSSDLAGLFSLRASLGLRARDWPRRADPCSSWAGVSCRSGRVRALTLSGLLRTRLGRLSPRFAVDGLQNLSQLEVFNSSGFSLPGSIPEWFGSRLPRSLSVIDLTGSAITGSIPDSLSGVSGLVNLSLAGNFITGVIPPSLSQLSNLTLLDLSSNFLDGSIPPSLGTLRNLQTLILSNNSLSGPIPPQFGDLSRLVSLDLSLNSLVGSLQDDFTNLRSLQSLDLAGNSLSGTLTGSFFSRLSQLRLISLSRNNFSGAIPESLWSLPALAFADLSHNNFTGTFPDLVPSNAGGGTNVTGGVFSLSNNSYYGSISSEFGILFARFSSVDLSANYFQGSEPVGYSGKNVSFARNCLKNALEQRSLAECLTFYAMRGLPFDGSTATPGPSESPGRKKGWNVKYILIGVFSGIAFLVIVIVVVVLCMMRRGGLAAERRERSANVVPSGGGLPSAGVSVNLSAVGDSFTYEQLLRATSEFSDANLIKHGHSGDLYHGVLEGGARIVVKKIDILTVKKEAYVVELDLFTKASHTRLVPLLGHCLDNENEKFLVYKFMPNGDLSSALYRKNGSEEEGLQSLDWITRLKIATGLAEALCFLHHECNPPLVHRDVQASSILLDDKFEVRLGSLSEVSAQEGDGHQKGITRFLRLSQTSEAGNFGSPSATCAYDVYCLGKVLLELVTGKLGISGSNNVPTNEWLDHTLPYINIYEKELVIQILDPSLIVDEDLLEEVWAMAIVAKSCLNPKPSKRPLVRYILKALENPLKVVREENSSGSARLRTTSSHGSWNAALFGSWRRSSSDITMPPRDDRGLKRSGTMGSQGSGGEHSFNHKRPSREIFPEPSVARDTDD